MSNPTNHVAIDKLFETVISLIQSGNRAASGVPSGAPSGVSSAVSEKLEAFALAKSVKALAPAASVEAASLSEDQADELAFILGNDLLRILGGK